MNLTEEKGKLESLIEEAKAKAIALQEEINTAKKKLKTIEKLIAKANETIGNQGVS